jgi:NAD(P)-dependent dehydrogenase (short-subunit alcohol dehydrogenase family)
MTTLRSTVPPMRLNGKVAVVTGGGNGIGRACCERFAAEGADIVVADVLEGPGKEVVAAVEAAGRRAVFVQADAASPEDNDATMQRALDGLGRIDVLVTSAGISGKGYRSDGDTAAQLERSAANAEVMLDPVRSFTDFPLDDWHAVLEVNLTGTLLAMQSAARRMTAGGSIITLASIAAKQPEAGTPSYSVSKAGVWMLTKFAAKSLAAAGIRVNAIGPGFIDTNMTAIVRAVPQLEERFMAHVPMGRFGTPQEIANTALFLASDESSYTTGEIFHVDGGFYTE